MFLPAQYHHKFQSDPANSNVALGRTGLDLTNGKLRDNVSAGVLEPMLIKLKSISFATEAAISILRIDDMIKITPCAPPYPSAPALLRRPSAAFAAPRRQR